MGSFVILGYKIFPVLMVLPRLSAELPDRERRMIPAS